MKGKSWSSDDAIALLDEDRREWVRKCAGLDPQQVSIRLGPGSRLDGEIIDESSGGLGVRICDKSDVQVGEEIEVYYRANIRHTVVLYIKPADPDGWRIGLKFVDAT